MQLLKIIKIMKSFFNFEKMGNFILHPIQSRLIVISYSILILILPLYALFSYASNASWSLILEKATDPIAVAAYTLTIKMALYTAIINTIFGFIIAWVLTRYNFSGKRIMDAIVDLPLALPTSVAGLALSTVFGRNGLFSSLLDFYNYEIIYTKRGILLAMIFVSFPFSVRAIQPILKEINKEEEEAAWSLGSGPLETFKRFIFPIILPAILNGFTLTFSRALSEFGSIVMVAGNLPLQDLVSSVLISQYLEQYDYIGACVISIIVLILACSVLLFVQIIHSLVVVDSK